MTAKDPRGWLTEFQVEVAQLFFSLPASGGFLLAGGAALLAHGLTARATQDLDFFTRPDAGDVGLARDQFIAAADVRGWHVDRVQDAGTFCRLLVHGPEDLLVDLALDSAPGRPGSASIAGPTFAPDELAGRKVIALFDRAAARDFVDVYALSRRFSTTELLGLAREVDAGFDPGVFTDMLKHLARYADVDLALGDVDIAALRAFFQHWIAELNLGEH
ncbi:MAG: nucleotidyl transferase AbiEii/AbiGii toxin family protein [Jatrophihabitans sp.]